MTNDWGYIGYKMIKFVKTLSSFQEFKPYYSLVMFTFGCNFRCKYCYNYDFITDKSNIINPPIEEKLDLCFDSCMNIYLDKEKETNA